MLLYLDELVAAGIFNSDDVFFLSIVEVTEPNNLCAVSFRRVAGVVIGEI